MTTTTVEGNLEKAPGHVQRHSRRSRFLRMIGIVTAVIHLPVAAGVMQLGVRLGWTHPALIGWAWGAAGLALFFRRARAGMMDRRRSEVFVWLADIPYFIHWCAAVWSLIPSVVAILLAVAIDLVRGAPLHWPMDAFMWSYLSGLAVCGYGTLIRRRWFRVIEREVPIVDLDSRLEGLRIAHLSDLHIGGMTPRSWGLSWSAAANRCNPDIAVVTGDMVTSGTEFHEDVAEVVGALRAKSGVFVAMGNHDYFGDGEPLITMLGDRHVRVLRNEGVSIARNGSAVWLAAVDDTWTRRDDLPAALRARPAEGMTILLAHDPGSFDAAADAGVELVLSGHTHGGQIGVPFFSHAANLATFVYKYTIGFYRRGRSVLYVHPGLGTTGPPMRLGVAPEVTILVLRGKSLAS